MKSQELRIGNETNFGIVRGIYPANRDGETQIIFDAFMTDESKVNPIPLTEEWLLKFGFEKFDGNGNIKDEYKKPDNWYYTNPEHNYYWEDGHMFLDSGSECGWSVNPTVEYVHQLQNLHFALTQKELEIK